MALGACAPVSGLRPGRFLPGAFQRAVLEDLGHSPDAISEWWYKGGAKGAGKGGGGGRGSGQERVGHKRASLSRLSVSEGRANNRQVAWCQQFWFMICLFLFLFLGLNVLTVVPPTVQVAAGTVRLKYKPCAVGASVGALVECPSAFPSVSFPVAFPLSVCVLCLFL